MNTWGTGRACVRIVVREIVNVAYARDAHTSDFGRQPSTVPTDARDSWGLMKFYSEVEV